MCDTFAISLGSGVVTYNQSRSSALSPMLAFVYLIVNLSSLLFYPRDSDGSSRQGNAVVIREKVGMWSDGKGHQWRNFLVVGGFVGIAEGKDSFALPSL